MVMWRLWRDKPFVNQAAGPRTGPMHRDRRRRGGRDNTLAAEAQTERRGRM